MRKTTIEIDDRLLAQAAEILGTRGLKDTVHRALREVLVHDARLRHIQQLKEWGLPPDEAMNSRWR